MSLEGTLETIALPDVLALLSVTAKTGELRIESGGGVGSVWFEAGQVAGFDVGTTKTPVDALFTLLRLKEGSFKFHTGTAIVNPLNPQDVAPVLDEAESRLVEWPGIAAVVPSVYSGLKLRPSVEGTVMLRPDQWQLVATIGGGRTVAEVLSLRDVGEYEGCRAVKELVDLRLVDVAAGPAPVATTGLRPAQASQPDQAGTARVPAPPADLSQAGAADDDQDDGEVADLSEVWEDEGSQAHQEGEGQAAEAGGDPVNRGLLLKFLGSARN